MRSLVNTAACALLVSLLLPEGGTCFAPSLNNHVVNKSTFSSIQASIITHAKITHNDNNNNMMNLQMVRNDIEGTDRILSCVPYIIPLLDGDRYGRFLFYQIPLLGLADNILLGPFKLLYGVIPFAQFIFFIGLSILSRNPEIPRPIRFNMQQALLLDIALIFPSLLGQIPVPQLLANSGSNFVYLALVGCIGYAIISNLSGRVPDKIPVISDAAGSSIM